MNKLRFLINIISATLIARGWKKLFGNIRLCRNAFDKVLRLCYIIAGKHFYYKELFNE